MTIRKKIWQFVILGLVVTLLLSIYADFGRLVSAFRSFEWALLPAVLGLTLGNQLLRFIKWEYLLDEVNVDLPLLTSFLIFGSGLIMIMTPGKVGEVWKSWLIRDTDGTPISTTIPVIATERITDVLGVVSISLLGVLAFDRSPVLVFALLIPILAGILFLQYERGCLWLIDRCQRLPVVGRKADSIQDLYRNARELLRLRPLGVTTVLSVFSWGLECVGLWIVLRGFDVGISVFAAAFVFAVASILGAISLLPGGLGVTEGSMTGLLLFFGVSRVPATSATLVIRATTLWFVAILALAIYTVYRHRSTAIRGPEDNTQL